MDLHEFQAKRLFAEHGMPIPNGDVATTAAQAREIADSLGGRVVVKAQVHIGGRGKAGGVKLAQSAAEAEAHAQAILGMDIKGLTVHQVLIDELAPGGIEQELYLAILIDRANRLPMVMASADGGMDIEAVAAETPDRIIKVHIDPLVGVRSYQSTYVASRMGLPTDLWKQFHKIALLLIS